MSWNPVDNPVDHVMLAGKRSPGIATLSGWEDVREFDERRGYALSGSTLIYKGGPLLRGKLTLLLTTTEEFDAWNAWKTLLARPPATPPIPGAAASADTVVVRRPRPRVLDIVHPLLADLGVRRVVVERRPQLEPTDDGGWTVEISLIEHRPPVRAIQRQTSSVVATPPLDALDTEIVRLTGQVQALASGVNEAAP